MITGAIAVEPENLVELRACNKSFLDFVDSELERGVTKTALARRFEISRTLLIYYINKARRECAQEKGADPDRSTPKTKPEAGLSTSANKHTSLRDRRA